MTSLSLVASADINITLANLVGNNQFMKSWLDFWKNKSCLLNYSMLDCKILLKVIHFEI